MIENDPLGYAAVLVAMTVAVYLMRAGGYWLIGRVPIGPRLTRMLDALPGAVIAAPVVAPHTKPAPPPPPAGGGRGGAGGGGGGG
jgi:uncharacterized membrane protein